MVTVGRWVSLWVRLAVALSSGAASVSFVTSEVMDVSPLALPHGRHPNLCTPDHVPSHPIIRCEVGKRQAFHPWGGKRSSFKTAPGLPLSLREVYLALFQNARPRPPPPSEGELKRASFNPWGGKRSDPLLPASQHEPNTKRNTFAPWGGKRAAGYFTHDTNPLIIEEDLIPYIGVLSDDGEAEDVVKRESFSAWGGKRGSFPADDWEEEEPTDLFVLDGSLPYPPVDRLRYKREAETYTNTLVNSDDSGVKTEAENIKPDTKYDQTAEASSTTVAKRTRFSAWAGKRPDLQVIEDAVRKMAEHEPKTTERRAFSAWAGKRSSDVNLQDGEDDEPVSAWIGRRLQDANTDDKRTFSAWAGKRSPSMDLSGNQDKRTFRAWAGKRSSGDELDDHFLDKKTRFSPWAGKRAEGTLSRLSESTLKAALDENSPEDNVDNHKRPSFSAWAGKRSESNEKRPSFNAWAGKRSDSDEKRPSFSAWAGKRSDIDEKRPSFNAWAGKRSDSDEKRPSFSAWAGKRSDIDEKRPSFNAWAGKRSDSDEKRPSFSAWAGKRSSETDKRQGFSAWAGKRNNGGSDDPTHSNNPQQISSILQQLQHQGLEFLHKRLPINDWGNKRVPFSTWGGKRASPISEDSQLSDLYTSQL
ncbi:uncharacterized protein LOC121876462 [Homarus americanus]